MNHHGQCFNLACKCGNINIVRTMIQEDIIDIDFIDEYNSLSLASVSGHLSIVKYLIGIGASIHVNYSDPLHTAIIHDNMDIVKYLIEQGADISDFDDHAVFLAWQRGHLDILKYLIQHYKHKDLRKLFFSKRAHVYIYNMYIKMKQQALLLYKVYNEKLPTEIQKIIFTYI